MTTTTAHLRCTDEHADRWVELSDALATLASHLEDTAALVAESSDLLHSSAVGVAVEAALRAIEVELLHDGQVSS